jgi:hypothetical protein
MFQFGALAGGLRVEHRHSDGSWSVMEQRDPHDAAAVDPEREWDRGHVYLCSCGEEVRLSDSQEDAMSETPGAA